MTPINVPDHWKGPLYMVWSCILFAVLWAIIRHVSETVHPFLIVFYRSLFAALAMMPFFYRVGFSALKSKRYPLHMLRGFTGTVATFSMFYAIAHVPLADVVGISYAAPIFGMAGAALFLGETIRLRRIMAVVFGFIGMLIIVRPGLEELTWPVWVAIIGSISIGGSMTCIKALIRTERAQTVTLYPFLIVIPFSLAAGLTVWQWPTLEEFALLMLIGWIVSISHVALAKAFMHSEASAVLPFDFVRLLLATTFGVVFYNEGVDMWTMVGAAVILVATVYSAHREAQMSKKAALMKTTDLS